MFFPWIFKSLSLRAANALEIRFLVLRGWMTSSINPRSAATNGFANVLRSLQYAEQSFFIPKIISVYYFGCPFCPITAISAVGHA